MKQVDVGLTDFANEHNVRICGEIASADNEAALKFPGILQRVIEEDGFREHQIFNVDETEIFWKIIPTRTYICSKEWNVAAKIQNC